MKFLYTSALYLILLSAVSYSQKPCPGIPTVKYEAKIYHTVKIGSQCWLKENLNVGVMVDSAQMQSNNDVIEKYCYHNDPANCSKYGGLYQWYEALQYSSETSNIKGICPKGWRIPDTTDFGKLSMAVNKNSKALKSFGQGDASGIGNNNSGFSALLAGSRQLNGAFFGLNGYTYMWTIKVSNSVDAFDFYLNHGTAKIYQSDSRFEYGFSVRCIKD